MDEAVPPNRLTDEDYSAIEAAVMETERGRWFLAEYARRNRSADTASILEALTKLEQMSEPSGGPAGGVSEVLAMLAELKSAPWQGVTYREPRPAHERPQQAAQGAITATRRTAEKIREVAYELRETGRNEMFADALELYCQDLGGAADLEEDAVRRLADIAGMLVMIEARLRGGNGGTPPPGEPHPRPIPESNVEALPSAAERRPAAKVETAPPMQPEPADHEEQHEELAPRAVNARPTLAFFNPG